jgi:hypothetical protein
MVAVGSDENNCVGERRVGELVGAKLCGSCPSFQCCLAAREFIPQDSLFGFYVNDLNLARSWAGAIARISKRGTVNETTALSGHGLGGLKSS